MSVPLSTIKSALKIDYTDDDTELIRLREVANVYVEKRTGLALSARSETLYLSTWTDSLIPVAPYTGLTHVRYYDTGNNQVTMPAADYWLDQYTDLAKLNVFLQTWKRSDLTVMAGASGYRPFAHAEFK